MTRSGAPEPATVTPAEVGRNVWQHPNPPRIAEALGAIVHANRTVEDGLDQLQEKS